MLVAVVVAAVAAGCDDDDGEGAGATSTTVSTSSTTVPGATTTVIIGDTTTTVIVDGEACVVTWSVTNDVTLGALQFDTSYANAPGEFEGSDDLVSCVDLTLSLASFNDRDSQRNLSAGLISLAGIDAPREVIECNFVPNVNAQVPPNPGDFVVTVVDAADPSLNPVSAQVQVTGVRCDRTGISTSTVPTTAPSISTSTTTVTTTTSTTFGGPLTGIGFTVVEPVRIGAIQFAVDYTGAPGFEFDGAGGSAHCFDHVGGIVSFNDDEANSILRAGIISVKGFNGPRLMAECQFTATGRAPVPSDFVVTVEDATDPQLNPIVPFPTVAVSVPEP